MFERIKYHLAHHVDRTIVTFLVIVAAFSFGVYRIDQASQASSRDAIVKIEQQAAVLKQFTYKQCVKGNRNKRKAIKQTRTIRAFFITAAKTRAANASVETGEAKAIDSAASKSYYHYASQLVPVKLSDCSSLRP